MFVFGGFDGSRVMNDLYSYDIPAGVWSQMVHTGVSPPARAGHTATTLGVPAHLLVFVSCPYQQALIHLFSLEANF